MSGHPTRRGYFLVSLGGAVLGALLVGVLLVSMLPVEAATGDPVIAGAENQAGQQTTLRSNSLSTLTLVNSRSTDGSALSLFTPVGTPPFRVNRGALVRRLNADKIDGMHASELAVPSGAVMFFNATTCPAGWSYYSNATGRTVVGVQPTSGNLGDTHGGRVGPVGELTTDYVEAHSHIWSQYWQSSKSWTSWNATGSRVSLVDWDNGIHNDGSGEYPLQPADADEAGTGTVSYYTEPSGRHNHLATLPHVLLLACEKD